MQAITNIFGINRVGRGLVLFVLAIVLPGWNPVFSQGTIGNNPLSRLGIGEIMPTGGTRDISMSGATIALPSSDFQNLQNPALLSYNRATNFELGIYGYRRYLTDNSFGTKLSGGGGPAYVSLSFPVSKKVVVSIGLRPNSFTYYSITSTNLIIRNDTTKYSEYFNGTGGTSRAGFNVAYTLSKKISLGLQADYLFGTTNNYFGYQVNTINSETTQLHINTRLSGFSLKPGLFMRENIDTTRNIFVGLGVYYETFIPLTSTQSQFIEHIKDDGSVNYNPDTLSFENHGKINLPGQLAVGLGIQRPLHWSIGLDGHYSSWQNYQSFGTNGGLKPWYSAALGAEFLPNYLSNSLLNRITYRTGVSYQKTAYLAGGNQVDDISVSLGVSLPVTRKEAKFTRPFINLAVVGGRRGSLSQNDYSDTYFRFQFSISLNDLMWFNRYRVD